jgi:hypothetical protein
MPDQPHSTLTADQLHKGKATVGGGTPSGTPEFNGELFLDIRPGDRTTLWGASGAAWVAIAGTPIFGGLSPAGAITPDYKGQFYYGASTDTFYLAIGTTASDWVVVAVTTAAVGSGGS